MPSVKYYWEIAVKIQYYEDSEWGTGVVTIDHVLNINLSSNLTPTHDMQLTENNQQIEKVYRYKCYMNQQWILEVNGKKNSYVKIKCNNWIECMRCIYETETVLLQLNIKYETWNSYTKVLNIPFHVCDTAATTLNKPIMQSMFTGILTKKFRTDSQNNLNWPTSWKLKTTLHGWFYAKDKIPSVLRKYKRKIVRRRWL